MFISNSPAGASSDNRGRRAALEGNTRATSPLRSFKADSYSAATDFRTAITTASMPSGSLSSTSKLNRASSTGNGSRGFIFHRIRASCSLRSGGSVSNSRTVTRTAASGKTTPKGPLSLPSACATATTFRPTSSGPAKLGRLSDGTMAPASTSPSATRTTFRADRESRAPRIYSGWNSNTMAGRKNFLRADRVRGDFSAGWVRRNRIWPGDDLFNKSNLIDFLQRCYAFPDFLERSFPQRSHALVARGLADFRRRPLIENQLADPV